MPPSFWTRLIRPFTVNDVTTEKPGAYPELTPLTTTADTDQISESVRSFFAAKNSHWQITDESTDGQRFHAEIETALWGFIDDVTIWVNETETGEDGTVRSIHVRSCSRIGKGDLGKNARNIREIRRGLADRLPVVSRTVNR